jgi:heterotetrameric sarcosine oxidase delta subunit
MMLIPCPWCGPRSQIEFTYGGDATLRRPAPDAPEAAWTDYVYLRDNPCGPLDELWYHGAGCRSWFVVRRNTRTHDILASAPAGASSSVTGARTDTPADGATRGGGAPS